MLKTRNIVNEVRDFVKGECLKPTSNYGFEPFEYHFKYVVKYALQLSDIYGGDKEIIEISSWLHDIGSIVEGRKDHHITGSKIAVRLLKELEYPDEKIKLVKKCILNHRGSQDKDRTSIEEQIVAEADSLSNFDNIGGIFKAAFVYEGLDQMEAQKSVYRKLENKYRKLHFEESKKIIKPKYDSLKILLNN